MKSVEQLKAEQAKALANLEAQHAIANAMPVRPHYVDPSRLIGCPSASIKVKGFKGARDALAEFTVVPFAEYRNGCLSLKPLELLPEKVREDECANWAVQISVEQMHGGYGPNLKMRFYARIPGMPAPSLISVTLDVEGPDYIGAFRKVGAEYRLKRDGITVDRDSIRPNARLNGHTDKVIRWASGGSDSFYFSYLISADYADEDAAPDQLAHCFATLENIISEFEGNE